MKNKMSDGIKAAKEMGKKGLEGLYYLTLCPLIIPTYARREREEREKDDTCNCDKWVFPMFIDFAVSGLCLGMVTKDGNLYGLAAIGAIVTSNLVSGLYEWYGYEKNKEKSSTVKPEVKPNELEKKVEEPVKLEPIVETKPKKKYVNPFEVDFEE